MAAATAGFAVSIRSYPPSHRGRAKRGSEQWAEARTPDEILNHGQRGHYSGSTYLVVLERPENAILGLYIPQVASIIALLSRLF
jgi:hypothetical protein